jgi:threonine dehydratase
VTDPDTPGLTDVEAAARRIAGLVWHTPIVRSAWLSDLTRADVWLKLEIAQATGSYKVRGAANALAVLRESRPDVATVVTASAGNHGHALAWAGHRLGLSVRVHVPAQAPAAKRDAIRRLGAALVEAPTYDEAESRAIEDANRTGAVYVSPYNDPRVIAGAGTVALEMFADRPELDVVVAPLGGGGLLSGTAIVARSRQADVTVIGAEAEASPAFTSALHAGQIVPIEVGPTLADSLAGNLEPGSRTFELVRDLTDRVALVAESSIEMAMRELILQERLIAEGASATAIGALLQGGLDLTGRAIGVILSGRNVDGHVLRRVLGTTA